MTWPVIAYIVDPESDEEEESQPKCDESFSSDSDDSRAYSDMDDEYASEDTGNTVKFGTTATDHTGSRRSDIMDNLEPRKAAGEAEAAKPQPHQTDELKIPQALLDDCGIVRTIPG